MTNLETVAAQRDEANAKLREIARKLAEANDEIARLKGERPDPPVVPQPSADRREPQQMQAGPAGVEGGEIPIATPPKSKRPSIFGGKP